MHARSSSRPQRAPVAEEQVCQVVTAEVQAVNLNVCRFRLAKTHTTSDFKSYGSEACSVADVMACSIDLNRFATPELNCAM